jgi:hypothetical protein
MANTADINLGKFNVGSVDRLRFPLTKDGVPWNLSGGSVQLTFKKPDRVTVFTRAAVAENAAGGIFYYDTTTSDIDTPGWWTVSVQVTDGTVVKKYPYDIGFYAVAEPK